MMFMNLIAVFANIIASLGTTVLVMRAANRRIQLLALSVGLLTLCQTMLLAGKALQQVEPGGTASEGLLRLSAGALSLAVVHLLNRENKDRRNVDQRIRCYEPEPATEPQSAALEVPVPSALDKPAGQGGGPITGNGKPLRSRAQQEQPADRRRSRRYRVVTEAEFRFVDGPEQYNTAEVQNISRTGMCFVAAYPAAIGSSVVVRVYGHRMRGSVVRCIPIDGGYQYGVEFDPHLRTGKVAELLRHGLKIAV